MHSSPQDNSPRLRSCGPEDAAALALAGAATFLETFAGILEGANILEHCAHKHSAEFYRALLTTPRVAACLMELLGAPVGYALLTPPAELPIPLREDDLELKLIYMLARFQGTGAGRAMMDWAKDRARAAGARRLLLGVYGGNARAIAFYRSQGFIEAGTRTFHIGRSRGAQITFARFSGSHLHGPAQSSMPMVKSER